MDSVVQPPAGAGSRARCAVLGIFLFALSLVSPSWSADVGGESAPGELEVTVMDVGQGDGIYIKTPGGKNILIDAGPDARRGVLPFLRSRRIKTIHTMVLTHPHADHIGGAISPRDDRRGTTNSVLEFCQVLEVLDCGKPHTTPEYKSLLGVIESKSIAYRQPKAGDRLDWDPSLEVLVLHPDDPEYENMNDNSVVIHVKHGRLGFLFTGDAEKEAEEVIAGRFGERLKSDVLKVGHHGSLSSTSETFLDYVSPRYGLISCGRGNSFDHPRPHTLEKLEAADVRVLRTDEDGFLTFWSNGDKLRWFRSPTPFPKIPFDPGEPDDFESDDWKGREGAVQSKRLRLRAGPGENLWAGVSSAPRWMRTPPESPTWSCAVAIDPPADRKTEAGLILYRDARNFILFGIQEGFLTGLTVVRKGNVEIGPELLAVQPKELGFQRTGKGINFVALDHEKKSWRPLWRLSDSKMPEISEESRMGVYVKSWGNETGEAEFNNFRIRSR